MSRLFPIVALSSVCIVMNLSAEDSTTVAPAPDSVTAATVAQTQQPSDSVAALPLFTLKEVAAFNGSGGKPAYVAIEGVVYDMSPIKAWKKGRHHGHTAGFDLTKMLLKKSPHGPKVLKKLKAVGRVAEDKAKE
jgi:predicted heme/steroid binding protein